MTKRFNIGNLENMDLVLRSLWVWPCAKQVARYQKEKFPRQRDTVKTAALPRRT